MRAAFFGFVNVSVLSNTFTDISVSVEEDLMKGVSADHERPVVDHIASWINSTLLPPPRSNVTPQLHYLPSDW